MENYFALQFDEKQVNAVSNLGLAHIGDAVYELLCRSYLCCKGDKTVKNLHKDSVAMVKAPTQAKYADKILPYLTEQEKDWFLGARMPIPTLLPSLPPLRNMPRRRAWKHCLARSIFPAAPTG